MNKELLIQELIQDEGEVLHAYLDSEGYLSLGVGRLIDERRGGGITREESRYLLNNDIEDRLASLPPRLPFWNDLSDSQQRALINMAFQLGTNGVLKFRKMLDALGRGDVEEAHREALNSRWARQTPNRALRVAGMLLE